MVYVVNIPLLMEKIEKTQKRKKDKRKKKKEEAIGIQILFVVK